MKPYGLPRYDNVENPDIDDIKTYGLKTSVGGKDYFKNKKAKKRIRRIFKRKARAESKQIIEEERSQI